MGNELLLFEQFRAKMSVLVWALKLSIEEWVNIGIERATVFVGRSDGAAHLPSVHLVKRIHFTSPSFEHRRSHSTNLS